VTAQQARLRERRAAIRAVVAIVSGKGGVGKSTLTANLATCFARDGLRVGVLDADLNGPTMAKLLGVRGRKLVVTGGAVDPPESALGVKVMSMDLLLPSDDAPLTWDVTTPDESYTWRATMEANALREFLADTRWGPLDMLLVDLPPGADRLATLASVISASGTIVVTIPSDVAHLIVRKSITVARQAHARVLGLVENMAGLLPGPDGAALARAADIRFLGSLPFDRTIAEAGDRGESLLERAPDSPAAGALRELAAAVRAALAEG
jgi:ATP-binding protein involved in chromosome partitioning